MDQVRTYLELLMKTEDKPTPYEAGKVIFEGILAAGHDFALPERVTAPVLRVGNAGAVFVMVGAQTYGPIGRTGQVVGNLSLLAADVTSHIPQAAADAAGTEPGGQKLQRAEVTLTQ